MTPHAGTDAAAGAGRGVRPRFVLAGCPALHHSGANHGRALTTHEWLELIADTGLTRHEHAPKAMDFQSWVKTKDVAPDMVVRRAAMLDEASPALQAFLKPSNEAGKRGFILDGLIAIARKA